MKDPGRPCHLWSFYAFLGFPFCSNTRMEHCAPPHILNRQWKWRFINNETYNQRDIAMNKNSVVNIIFPLLSTSNLLLCYNIFRTPKSYHGIAEELSDSLSFRGPLLMMVFASPHAYALLLISLIIFFKKSGSSLKKLIWAWIIIFTIGSAWTAFFIFAIANS